MEKNKSIDGLVSRRSKKTAQKSAVSKNKVITKKSHHSSSRKATSKQKNTKELKVANIEDFLNDTPINPLAETEPVKKLIQKENTSDSNSQTEDFLNPVKAFDLDEETHSLSISKNNQSKKMKLEKEKKKPGRLRKTISITALVIVLILIGGVIWVILWGNDIIAKITGGQGNVFDLIFTKETYEPLKTDENGRTNILAFGTSGYNMEGEVGNNTHDGAALTDSIMFISLDQETGDIAMLSLPRDLKASPTCTATGKINEVYWCNNMNGDNELAGAEALMSEVSSILGVSFQYYAHINWGSLIQIVDVIDGITITLDEDITDYYYTGAVYQAGVEYTLNGDAALGLARARHGTISGDFSRGASQQKILIGIKNKLLEKNLNITDYLSLATTLGDNLRTNFSIEELKSLAHLSSTLDFDSMRQISLLEPEQLMTTGTINGISYVLPSAGVGNYGKIQNHVAKMISSDPRVYEDSSILVLNGTGTTGLANTEKLTLEKEGYANIETDNAPEGEYNNKYDLYALTDKPGTRTLLEQHYNTSAKPTDELPENISRDYDFIIILGGKTDTEQ